MRTGDRLRSRTSAAECGRSVGSGWWWRWPTPPRRVSRAHDPDGVAIGISDDGIPCSPERVVRFLLRLVASRRQPLKQFVDGGPFDDAKPDDRSARSSTPATVPLLSERLAVEVDIEAVAGSDLAMVVLPTGIEVGDLQAEKPIERQHCPHVTNNDVDLIESRTVLHPHRLPDARPFGQHVTPAQGRPLGARVVVAR